MPLLEQVLEIYSKDVKLVFKNFPLRNHNFAKKAAVAVLAARRQGMFWEFHDQLFSNFNRLNDQTVRENALQLKLNLEEFEKDIKNPKLVAMINQDIRLGARVGVKGTPTVFINEKFLRERTLNGFQSLIEKELKKASSDQSL